MRRFLRNIGISLLVLLAGAWAMDRALTHLFQRGKGSKVQWQCNMRNTHYDLIVLGSSRGWWNIDLNTVDTACGLRCASLANNECGDPEMLLTLRLFLENGNTADRVLVHVDHHSLTATEERRPNTFSYELLPYLDASAVKAYTKDLPAEWTVMRYLPLWRYVKCNSRWGVQEALATFTGHRRPTFDSTGSYFSDANFYGADTVHLTTDNYHLSADMRRLIDLCEARGMQLDFFMAPYYHVSGPHEALDGPRRVITGAGYRFHDLSDRLRGDTLFNDALHTSIAGGQRLTGLLVREVICPPEAPRPTAP